jgi:hypothetical protein
MKRIRIQDVSRATLEHVVLSIVNQVWMVRGTISDIYDAMEHGALTKEEACDKCGEVGMNLLAFTLQLFEAVGFIEKGGAE